MASVSKTKEPLSKILFECKTHNAYALKILVELLNYYLSKKGSFRVAKNGIFLCNSSEKEDVLCDLKLLAENFQQYDLFGSEISFSLNLNSFYNEMLKKIKKKDSLCLQILEDDGKTYIKVIKETNANQDNSRFARTPILLSGSLPVTPPTGYSQPVNVISSVFREDCREVTQTSGKIIEVSCWNEKVIWFFSKGDSSVEKCSIFGKDRSEEKKLTFKEECSSAHLVRPSKLSALSDTVKIFVKKDLPIMYKMNVGSLGEICIYIKTLGQIQNEKDNDEKDNDEN